MILTSRTFGEICYALWGPDWRTPASQYLRRNERTMRRYADGDAKRGIPGAVKDGLLRAVREHIEVLRAYETELME